MSDDPTRPLPGWPSQPDPRGAAGGQGGGYPDDRGYRDGWGQDPQRGRGAQGDWGAPGGQRAQGDWGGPGGQRGQRGQGDWSGGGRAARPRRRHRGLTITAVVVLVLLILAVVADRVAAGIAENEAASQIKSAGFPVKPKVNIEGFPFLTQLAARDFHKVDISASNVKEGPLTIASVNATGQGVHLTSSFNGATVDQINGTALVTFAGLSSAAGLGDGITLSNGGNNELKANIDLGFISGTALAQVTRASSHQIEVKIVNAGPIPLSALGNASDFKISLPSLPAGMTIQSVSVTAQGVLISISGSHTSFGS
jgi:LmeA-like phospholipid-binding